jgi:hypothetical protein
MLVYDARRWPLGGRPIMLGRLPECDVVLLGDKVSRRHASIVASRHGPLLVDSSKHGTFLNGERIGSPVVLAEGDQLKIGVWTLEIGSGDLPDVSARAMVAPAPSPGRKVAQWISRYGPSEVVGTIAAVGTAVTVRQASGSTVAGAFAGSIAETLVFYLVMFLRESIKDAYQAGAKGRKYEPGDLVVVLRNLFLEFGAAELLDTLVLRPLCMGIGMRLIGSNLGALVGKLVADLAFYGPVLTVYEWRLARNRAQVRLDRSRRTTANVRRESS